MFHLTLFFCCCSASLNKTSTRTQKHNDFRIVNVEFKCKSFVSPLWSRCSLSLSVSPFTLYLRNLNSFFFLCFVGWENADEWTKWNNNGEWSRCIPGVSLSEWMRKWRVFTGAPWNKWNAAARSHCVYQLNMPAENSTITPFLSYSNFWLLNAGNMAKPQKRSLLSLKTNCEPFKSEYNSLNETVYI